MINDTIIYASIWILAIEIFSFATFPLISSIFYKIADRGFAISKILGILVSSYIMWILGSLHILKFNTISSVFTAIIVIFISLAISFSIILNRKEAKIKLNNKLIRLLKQLTNNKYLKWTIGEEYTLKEKKSLRRIIGVEEIIFLSGFIFWVFMRGVYPRIMGTEKFMDYGIMTSLLKSDYFPPHDFWLSGYSLNYYYYGHYIYTYITSITNLPVNYTYNFAIATILAFSLILSISIVYTLTKRIYASILGAFILNFAGNIHYMYSVFDYYLKHGNLLDFKFWYPDSTRLLDKVLINPVKNIYETYTINEFPIYSYIVADLHAHVTNIPIVLGALVTVLNVFLKRSYTKIDIAIYAMLLGLIAIINSWDAIFYTIILFGSILFINLSAYKKNGKHLNKKGSSISEKINIFFTYPIPKTLLLTGITGIIALILFTPYYISFKAPVDGVGLNIMTHSDGGTELILFGFFFFLIGSFTIYLIYSILKNLKFYTTDIFVIILIICGIALVILPEILFLKDIFYKSGVQAPNPYGPYFRANTVFKLYYQAWILFSISSGYIIARIAAEFKSKLRNIWEKIVVFIWIAILIGFLTSIFSYTYQAISQGYLSIVVNPTNKNSHYQTCITIICFNSFKTDDGSDYIKNEHPEDYAMIKWLNSNAKNDDVIVEAVGASYRYYGRISVNTGLSTLLGWPNHEYQWRNDYSYSKERQAAVVTIYTNNNLSKVKEELSKYNVKYIIVGDTERTPETDVNNKNIIYNYTVVTDDSTIKQAGKVVFSSGNSYILEVDN